MQCEDAIYLISARIDGELGAADRQWLEAHLADCADCRATAEAMQIQDAQLTRAFNPRRSAAATVAERVVGQLAPRRAAWRAWWMPVVASAAAGFLLAVLLFRPWQRVLAPRSGPAPVQVVHNSVENQSPAVGRLDLATGAVEFLPPGQTDWQPMVTGGGFPAGARLRTGPGVRCELVMNDGSQVRINQDSEVVIKSSRQIELTTGQVWSSVVKRPAPFQVAVADATVTAVGTRFDVSRKSRHITLAVLQGSTRLTARNIDQTVGEGSVVQVIDGRASEVTAERELQRTTRWIDEILIRKDPDSPALHEHVNDLLAHLGELKGMLLDDNELRSLGDHCVVPLTRYIQSDRSKGNELKRRELSNIVADVAQPWCIPYLIDLLDDQDGTVRYNVARALLRLTGEDQGRSPKQWRDEPLSACRPAADQWKKWWHANRDRYPGAANTLPIDSSQVNKT